MSKSFFHQPKGEGERIASHLQTLGLTFAPSKLEEMENNMQYSVEHVGDLCGGDPKWVTYEEVVDRKTHPDDSDAGKHRKIIVGGIKMSMIVPDMTDGVHQHVFVPSSRSTLEVQNI